MAKVLLVEDDNNLREIYEARLQAEGYEIDSAQDGEQALVVAKQFKPDLIISDVMMPKISGFEMLDILRNTEGLQHTRVIMLTALGQAEDKTRADSLGADRYLVKSQVTLEDIVKSAHEILDNDGLEHLPSALPGTEVQMPEPATAANVSPTLSVASPGFDPAATTPAAVDPTQSVQPPTQNPDFSVAAAPLVDAPAAFSADTGASNVPPSSPASISIPVTIDDGTDSDAPAPSTDPTAASDLATSTFMPAADNLQVGSDEPLPPGISFPEEAVTSATDSSNPAAPAAQPALSATDTAPGSTVSEQRTVNQQIEDFITTNDATNATPEVMAATVPQVPGLQPVIEPAVTPEANVVQPSLQPEPARQTQTDAAADDQLLSDAADSFAGNSTATSAENTVITPTSAVQPQPAPAEPIPAPHQPASQNASTNDNVVIANKKIIQPPDASTKPNLDELLAREQAKETGLPTQPTAVGTAPYEDVPRPPQTNADTAVPQSVPPQNPPRPTNFDPNNIAL